jgi:hypothetical protein
VKGNKDAVAAQSQWLAVKAKELGLVYRDAGPVTEIELAGAPGVPVLGLLVHGDVQPPGESGWTVPPFTCTLKDGYVYGRGSADGKGPLVQALLAMASLDAAGTPRHYTVRLLVGSDEESDNHDIATYLQSHKPPELTLVLDSEFPVVVGEKAWDGLEVTATDPYQLRDATNAPWAVVKAEAGVSAETIAAVERYRRRARVVALTDAPRSTIATLADDVIPIGAGEERGGVACRSFQHTQLALRAIEARLGGRPVDLPALCERVGQATQDLLDRRPDWLPEVAAALDGPDGVFLLAPAERLASAEQGALMIREGPRRPSVGCETGDWSHVDVYLTKTLDYRALLFTGSPWDGEALDWLAKRGSTFVAVRSEVPGAGATVRYAGDDDVDAASYSEVLVPELLAATWWAGTAGETG